MSKTMPPGDWTVVVFVSFACWMRPTENKKTAFGASSLSKGFSSIRHHAKLNSHTRLPSCSFKVMLKGRVFTKAGAR